MTIKPPSFLVIQGHQHSWHEKEYFAFFSWVLIIALVEKTTEIYFLCSAYEKHLWKSDILIIKNADQLPVFFYTRIIVFIMLQEVWYRVQKLPKKLCYMCQMRKCI